MGIAFRTLADLTVPNAPRETLDALVQVGRVALDAEAMARFLESTYDADLTGLLPRITTPTLVLHRQDDLVVNWQQGREVSATIPNARFTATSSTSGSTPRPTTPSPAAGRNSERSGARTLAVVTMAL